MSTYVIGDIQGCYQELEQLLSVINFKQQRDKLWFTGDLVNRGADSLAVLRLIKQLADSAVTVLGNHDLHLLAVYANAIPAHPTDTLDAILQAPDCDSLCQWLRQQPLAYFDNHFKTLLVHAGIYPWWTIAQTRRYAGEVEKMLRGHHPEHFLHHMYGNQPDIWHESLQGYERVRFITNCLTRLRLCSPQGQLDFTYKGAIDGIPAHYQPWYQLPLQLQTGEMIIFGHWAALTEAFVTPQLCFVDTGCVWGNKLTAIRLEDKKLFSVPALTTM